MIDYALFSILLFFYFFIMAKVAERDNSGFRSFLIVVTVGYYNG